MQDQKRLGKKSREIRPEFGSKRSGLYKWDLATDSRMPHQVETTLIIRANKISVWIGKAPKEAELKAMVDEAAGPINFTMLLTLFGDRLNGKYINSNI